MKKHILYAITLFLIVCIFFWKFLVSGLLPVPADTIVGLYHPFRDAYRTNYPNGIPYKNFLITDPIRQQYPWRELGITVMENGKWPVWNPYNGVGMPLLGNLQSALLYPLNILLFLLPFKLGWSTLIFLQPLLAGLFLYAYLIRLNLRREASLFGAVTFAFSGFFIAWLEWNTLAHVALWLPLILLIKEHIFTYFLENRSFRRVLLLFIALVFAESSYWLAGHLQTAFYVWTVTSCYLVVRVWQIAKGLQGIERQRFIRSIGIFFSAGTIIILLITFLQWWPFIQLVSHSARNIDQGNWLQEGWFIPWQHIVQFIVPDFFGNPATLNYWGVWNYAEMVGYIGILPLIFALLALSFRKDKKTFFFGVFFFASLIFATPTFLAKLPYMFNIPFLSTSQPTRLLFITDFSLSILAALGLDYLLADKRNMTRLWYVVTGVGLLFTLTIFFINTGAFWFKGDAWLANLAISKRNVLFPIAIFVISSITLACFAATWRKGKIRLFNSLIIHGFILIAVFDLLRFGWKFTPFTPREYLFPETPAIQYLMKQIKPFRVMATDKRILPPNFSSVFRIESVDVYDPLFLTTYGQLVSAWERSLPDISLVDFNRMITPQDYASRLADLLNIKYILSLSTIVSPKLQLVFEEGQTKIYENQSVFTRAFFVESVIVVDNSEEAMNKLFEKDIDLRKQAIVEEEINIASNLLQLTDAVEITEYNENTVTIKTNGLAERFMVLTDSYYPTWKAFVDGQETMIYRTDFMFRGILVPKGQHVVEFRVGLY